MVKILTRSYRAGLSSQSYFPLGDGSETFPEPNDEKVRRTTHQISKSFMMMRVVFSAIFFLFGTEAFPVSPPPAREVLLLSQAPSPPSYIAKQLNLPDHRQLLSLANSPTQLLLAATTTTAP